MWGYGFLGSGFENIFRRGSYQCCDHYVCVFGQWLQSRLGGVYRPFSVQLLHLTAVGALVVTLFLLVPAAVLYRMEASWTLLDCVYYCFISLTTVGLGDYIPGDSPGQPHRPLYKLAVTGDGVVVHEVLPG